ncbi:ATP-binding protein [Vibrio sp. JC009]|uniref:ATP-binding protein n=1 Tax=Vibrio sp. JC009 TaxID=2912314 RepID=UPI0023B17EAE|nr:ATP-binding protein [Vibrio sp. JC009]WED22273.1 ATP-binding protein [Vibrio sp. JC009]
MIKKRKKNLFKKLRNTLMTAFLTLSLIPLTLIALFFLHSHSKDLQEQSHSYLVSVRDTKQQQILDYFEAKRTEVSGFVRSELAYASGGRFYGLVKAFRLLGSDIEEARTNLKQRYITGSGDKIKTSVNKKSKDYTSTERYRLLHKRYHRGYVEHLKRSDFDDILLVDFEGNVAYSTLKSDNIGANLLSDNYKSTNLGITFLRIRKEMNSYQSRPDETLPVVISDFSAEHENSYAWFAAPIVQQGYLHSYALFRLPLEGIDVLVDDNSDALQLLLTGSDLTSRSSSLAQEDINNNQYAVNRALKGITEVNTYTNSKGERIIAASAPVSFMGLNWALSVQLSEDVAYARVHHLKKVFIAAMLLAFALVVIASHFLSRFITDPLLKLTWAAEKVSAGELEHNMLSTDRTDEIGRLAVSFERMRASIREKILTIGKQNDELEKNLRLIRQQNLELQQADKLKDEFLASTSYELRTPLHGIIGIAEALASGSIGSVPAHQKYQLEIIINSGKRLSNLVDDLLDYHKMRYGHMEINKQATDLFSATSLVLQLSGHLLKGKRIRILNQIPDELPKISADPERLEQVLYNLIGNAVRYTHEGKIVISATALNHHVRVQIVDTGQGIPPQYLEHADKFRQGTGIGLSISYQLIELMGGNLYISSQPYVGTTFSFSLPLASEDNSELAKETHPVHFQLPEIPKQPEPDSSAFPENSDGPLILVADANPVTLQVVESFLRYEGYRVITSSEGCEVLKQIQEEQPEILLLDIMLPGISSYEICESIRNEFSQAELPVIMLTSQNQTEERTKGFGSGANDYLIKPFSKQELTARVSTNLAAGKTQTSLLENHQLQQEVESQKITETELLMAQKTLLERLDSTQEAILCVNLEDKVIFANQAASMLFKKTAGQLTRSHLNELIARKYCYMLTDQYSGDIEIFTGDRQRKIPGDIITLPESSGIRLLFIFDSGKSASSERIHSLETAVEVLSSYACEGDKDKLEQLQNLGDEFKEVVQKVSGNAQDKQQQLRELLVAAMTTAIGYWETSTGKSKFDFAEASGLWRVYLDRSTLQTRTLDKYLRLETLPKTPRWRTVLSSLDYILDKCADQDTDQRKELEQLRSQLAKLI